MTIMQICKHVVAKVTFGSEFHKRDNACHVSTTVHKTGIMTYSTHDTITYDIYVSILQVKNGIALYKDTANLRTIKAPVGEQVNIEEFLCVYFFFKQCDLPHQYVTYLYSGIHSTLQIERILITQTK